MNFKKNFVKILFVTSILLVGWGSVGHRIINKNFVLSLNPEMSFLSSWTDSLSLHGSDADNRKGSDPNEAPKHYIDIDNYSEFNSTGRIPQSLDSLIAIYGSTVVYDNGILPWAIIAAQDSLKNAFIRRDWHKAMLFAADLGHYIGDGHMPLHVTNNYNGQLTNQNGIHSRYESNMIGTYSNQIIYTGDSSYYLTDISNFTFSYIYYNNKYADSVLAADIYAKGQSGGSYNTAYYTALWQKLGNVTINLFRLASYRLACYIYTAWVDAGRPNINGISGNNFLPLNNFSLEQNYPNPFNPSTFISYSIFKQEKVLLEIFDVKGKLVSTLIDGINTPGEYSVKFNPLNISSGVYFYKLSAGNNSQTKKMIFLK